MDLKPEFLRNSSCTHCCLFVHKSKWLYRIVVRKAMPASLSISNTLLALSGRARGRSSISESASAAAFAFPVAISFLFCNFLHNRQRFSANFGPIILVPIFFCPDFPSFQSFSPLKCAWWDCFRTRVTATLLADRVIRSGCEPLLARSTRTRSAETRFARSRSGRFFGVRFNRLWASIQGIEESRAVGGASIPWI